MSKSKSKKNQAMEYNYYFYDHMYMSIAEQDRIIWYIEHHDFDAFLQYYNWYQNNKINNPEGLCYFPDTIFVSNKNLPNWFEELSIFDRNNFNLITYAECECG